MAGRDEIAEEDQPKRLLVRAVAHAGTLKEGEFDLAGSQLVWKIGPGNLRGIDAGPFELGLSKIHAPEVGLAKIAVAEIEPLGIQPSQVETPQIAPAEIHRIS